MSDHLDPCCICSEKKYLGWKMTILGPVKEEQDVMECWSGQQRLSGKSHQLSSDHPAPCHVGSEKESLGWKLTVLGLMKEEQDVLEC